MSVNTKIRRGGRPSREEASKLQTIILDAAAELFFSEGYGSVSIEKLARRAKISKRTFYARFENKAAVFEAVVHRIIESLKPIDKKTIDALFDGPSLEQILRRMAPVILKASLAPSALALLRIVFAETERFPELAPIANEQGGRQEAVIRISRLLTDQKGSKNMPVLDPLFAAEQFLTMLTAGPQRRALGMGRPWHTDELLRWADQTVTLFMIGCRGSTEP
jgi:AcrR family transcriptional regulator